ncbi:MAG: hypothetical protein AAFR73_11405 [Pseudomonadota bacterium]
MKQLFACLFAVLMGFATQVGAFSVVVDRSDDALELYFKFPAPIMEEAFGVLPGGVVSDTGFVDFKSLQTDTVTPGNDLIANVVAETDGVPILLEAMSFMTHPTETDLPFETPWDALLTTTFCSVDPNGPGQPLDVMTTYVGYFADRLPPVAPIVIDFPWMDLDEREVQVIEFQDKNLVQSYSALINTDGRLTLFETSDRSRHGFFSFRWLHSN